MRRMASRTRTIRTNRARPVLESLEGRQLLSGGLVHQTRESAVASATGVFSQRDRQFSYIMPSGGHALIKIVGVGNLTGTTVSGTGRCNSSTAGPMRTPRSSGRSTAGGTAPCWRAS